MTATKVEQIEIKWMEGASGIGRYHIIIIAHSYISNANFSLVWYPFFFRFCFCEVSLVTCEYRNTLCAEEPITLWPTSQAFRSCALSPPPLVTCSSSCRQQSTRMGWQVSTTCLHAAHAAAHRASTNNNSGASRRSCIKQLAKESTIIWCKAWSEGAAAEGIQETPQSKFE
jgi:hypothetical protein